MKLIIFDVDGVLEKEERITKFRDNIILKAIKKKFNINSLKKAKILFDQSTNSLSKDKRNTTIYKFINLGFSREEFFNLIDKIDPTGLIEEHNNAKSTLKELSKKHKIVTYSNTSKKATVKTLNVLKHYNYINKVYSSQDFNESKPSTNNLKMIIKEQKFKPKDCFYIGNSIPKDIIPSKKVGMKSVLFDPYKKNSGCSEPDYIINDLKEILDII
jgi:putative hydrolase of the HAD superfamily